MIQQHSSRAWDGTKTDGDQNSSRRPYVSTLLDETRYPKFSQDDLSNDPELAGKYIVLTRVDGHATWVSRPVMDLMIAGGKIPKDVDGGEVIRDKDGFPTGITSALCLHFDY